LKAINSAESALVADISGFIGNNKIRDAHKKIIDRFLFLSIIHVRSFLESKGYKSLSR
jgi:hypothetical protein